VLFDLDYRPQRINIELDEVPLREALRMVALQSKTFWRPISTKAIFVAAESKTQRVRRQCDDNFSCPQRLDASRDTRIGRHTEGMLDIARIQVNPTHGTITLRGTPDQMVLAQKLITD